MSADAGFLTSEVQFLLTDTDPKTQTSGIIDAVAFEPIFDDQFISEDPRNEVQMLETMPIMTGFDKNEGTIFMTATPYARTILPFVNYTMDSFKDFNMTTYDKLTNDYFFYYPDNGVEASNETKRLTGDQYGDNGTNMTGFNVVEAMGEAVGDCMILCPLLHLADTYSRHNKV